MEEARQHSAVSRVFHLRRNRLGDRRRARHPRCGGRRRRLLLCRRSQHIAGIAGLHLVPGLDAVLADCAASRLPEEPRLPLDHDSIRDHVGVPFDPAEHTALGEVMSTYTATIRWSRKGDGDFAKGQYSRAHEWAFDGGAVVPASASPHIVPAPGRTRPASIRKRRSSPRCPPATCSSSSTSRGGLAG